MPALSWLRPRPSTIALALVFVCVLVGSWVTDRSLRSSDRERARLDALEIAALAEGFLDVHAEALAAFHGLYDVSGAPVDAARFGALVNAISDHVPGFRRIFVTDSAGHIVQQKLLGGASAPLDSGLDVDTVPLLNLGGVAQRARTTHRTAVSPPGRVFTGDYGFILLEPIETRGQFAGFAGATLTAAALRDYVARRAVARESYAVLLNGRDTVVTFGPPPSAAMTLTGTAPVRVHDGVWEVRVLRQAAERRVRLGLWTVAAGALFALALAVLYERRQARRIAERSRELEHLSAELLRANRAKSEFLANVSHELRTPLNAIVGFVDLLRDGVYGDLKPRQVAPVARIEASANHLRHLVDQILDLAKMAAGRLEVHTETISLRPFVFEVASEVESLINEKGLSLSLQVGASLPRVRTDPAHLRQILVNLLGNAVKFTEAGTIAVRARLVPADDPRTRKVLPSATATLRGRYPKGQAQWIALQVADTGIGIPEADRERIFDEFEQVNAGPRGDSMKRGTGLGLSISRRLTRLLGGDLTVESELGKGSAFTIWLPVDPADLKEPRGPTDPQGMVRIGAREEGGGAREEG